MHPAVLPLSREFEASNIERYDWDKYGRVLAAVHESLGISAEMIEAVSDLSAGLLVVSRHGHTLGDERGLFKKRIEVRVPVSYSPQLRLVRSQRGVRGRDGMLIEGFDDDAEPVFELSWGCGGPVSIEDAAVERDRVFDIMQRLVAPATG